MTRAARTAAIKIPVRVVAMSKGQAIHGDDSSGGSGDLIVIAGAAAISITRSGQGPSVNWTRPNRVSERYRCQAAPAADASEGASSGAATSSRVAGMISRP